ncbi:MAG: aminopeptidase P N-terminal domain-containing protein [Acidobacteria bacterium]|nr:aminopeptidase P N-terminal domain-containing protein [Acidobacteriota bacterium]
MKRVLRWISASAFVLLLIARVDSAVEPMLAGQPVADYRARRQQLIEQIKEGVVVLGGAHESDFGEVGRFRQNNYFQYLTGVETPGAYLILAPKGAGGVREMLFIPPRNPSAERWTGPQMGPGAEAEAAFGFERVLPVTEFRKTLAGLPGGEKVFYTVTPRPGDTTRTRESMLASDVRAAGTGVEGFSVRSVTPFLNRMRQTKTAAELALLQKAIDATGAAHLAVARNLRPGVYEYELEGDILGAFIRAGAERASFPSIVGSGRYSTILHYNRNRKQIDEGDLVVVDIGAEYSYYAADVTRTYPASGVFTQRQREIYDLVLEAQRRCEAAIEPGKTTLSQLTRVAREFFQASPLRAKDDKGAERGMDYFFTHSTSHWLGMDVHDVGDYARPLQAGDVFTIEPGIYIQSENLGVRIEDDYVITASGLKKLSGAIPSAASEIEALMKNRK